MKNQLNSTEVKELYIKQKAFSEAELTPGTTPEQWERYEMDKKNHEAMIQNKRNFLFDVLKHVEEYGVDNTRRWFEDEILKEWSMNAPNKPGYYMANND